jgi:hypothetical protein
MAEYRFLGLAFAVVACAGSCLAAEKGDREPLAQNRVPLPASAQDNYDSRDIYDVFRQSLKNPAGISTDEQTTAIIKRHMANLLYPVDMSLFSTPDKGPIQQRSATGRFLALKKTSRGVR